MSILGELVGEYVRALDQNRKASGKLRMQEAKPPVASLGAHHFGSSETEKVDWVALPNNGAVDAWPSGQLSSATPPLHTDFSCESVQGRLPVLLSLSLVACSWQCKRWAG